MASNPTDETSDDCPKVQSHQSFAQQKVAVSSLLSSLLGEADQLDLSHGAGESDATEESDAAREQVAARQDQDSDPSHADKLRQLPSHDLEEPSESCSSPVLNLAEQYGTPGLLAELNALAETQQFYLEQHRDYIALARAEQSQQIENWQARCLALEQQLQAVRDRLMALEQKHLESQAQVLPLTAQRDAAQAQAQRLRAELLERRQRQAGIEAQLELAEETMHEQQTITAAQAQGLVAMQAELSKAQAEVTALETRFSHQLQLRKQLREEGDRDRQGRSKARDRQLQLEQETTQMTGQLLRLGEELRQSQQQSIQWRRQAQAQAQTLRAIAQWTAEAESAPAELLELLEPWLNQLGETVAEAEPAPAAEAQPTRAEEKSDALAVHPSQAAPLNLPRFPSS